VKQVLASLDELGEALAVELSQEGGQALIVGADSGLGQEVLDVLRRGRRVPPRNK
jgi:hypothetical protein